MMSYDSFSGHEEASIDSETIIAIGTKIIWAYIWTVQIHKDHISSNLSKNFIDGRYIYPDDCWF